MFTSGFSEKKKKERFGLIKMGFLWWLIQEQQNSRLLEIPRAWRGNGDRGWRDTGMASLGKFNQILGWNSQREWRKEKRNSQICSGALEESKARLQQPGMVEWDEL